MRPAQPNPRSLVEQLAGIRLIAFLGLASLNLAALSVLCIVPISLEPPELSGLLFLVAAIVSLAALTVGGLNSSSTTKLCSLMIFLAACLWMVRWVSLPSDLKQTSTYASIYISQGLLIFMATMIYREHQAGFRNLLRFGITDLLLGVATVAFLIPVVRYIFSEWPINFLFQEEAWPTIAVISITNMLWTFAILFLYLKQGSWTRKSQLVVATLIAAVCTEILGRFWLGESNSLASVRQRTIFVLWIAISMLPIVGFESPEKSGV